MAVLNATGRIPEMSALAERIRATLEISDLTLIAILDHEENGSEALVQSGFDALLLKPFGISDLLKSASL